jgi:uncharacterized membrane protein HdeD (DUF308 family)
MLWSGSSPLTVVRDTMWGFLMFAGVAWLAIAWSVLRLEPSDVVGVAGPMILFGALCEGVRALAGTRTWWLNAGMGVLFAATGVIMMVDQGSTYATPAALIGWYLMVRGAMDVSVSTMNRGTDRTWGLMLALGVTQAGLGFYAASPLARTADSMVLVLGALGVVRAVADLVTALRLREVSGVSPVSVVSPVRHDVLHLPPDREAGVAGYSAGLTDYGLPQTDRARHRAGSSEAVPEPMTFHDEVVRSTKDLDSMIEQAGVTGTGAAAHRIPDGLPPAPDTPEGAGDTESIADETRR